MRISPMDIQQQRFRKSFRGYDAGEVDAFLELVYNEFEELIADNDNLRKVLKEKTNLADELLEREKTLKETMMTAQKVTQDMKANAKKEAELIKAEAELQAEQTISSAHDRLSTILDDINELKRQKAHYAASMKGLLELHSKMLDVEEKDESDVKDMEEKLKFMRRKRREA